MKRRYAVGMLAMVALLLGLMIPSAALAAGSDPNIVISTPFPWVVAEKGKDVNFSLQVTNNGKDFQELAVQIDGGPADWKPYLKSSGLTIKKIMVEPGGKYQMFDFSASPPMDAKAADYDFTIKALGASGVLVSDLGLKVSLTDKVGSGLTMTSQFPNLRGQSGTTFSFKSDVKNNAAEDRAVNFTAVAPQDWEVTFKPSYDTKQVSTVRIKAGDSQGMDIDVAPPHKVEAGDYAVKIQASAGNDRVEIPLNVTILGNYKLSLTTASGQLNTKATLDQPSEVPLIVRNTGASTLQNVSLSASKPDGWEVTFNPEKVDSLPPDQYKQVTAMVKPGGRALAGDYMVNVSASGGQTSDNKDIRVSVETPTTWGWAGIAVIVVVLAGLGGLFARLSRR